MPGMDRTGPMGQGSRTGRGMGLCGGGSAFGWRGRGFRCGGRGAGRGMMPIIPSVGEEKTILEQQKSWLENQLTTITQRLQGINTEE